MESICVAANPASAAPATGKAFAPPRRGLLIALALSVALHLALSLWPAELPTTPDNAPLQATITEMPPPPMPAPPAAQKPRPKPKRSTAPPPPAPVSEPVQESPVAQEEAPIEPTADAIAMGPEAPTESVAATETAPLPVAPPPPKTLPKRIDLVYKAFLGTHGFVIGEAVYRFEHAANEYHIRTVGEAKGLAALFLRGQGIVESRGLITATGLQPQQLMVERGSKERRETAVFDWETGLVTFHDQSTAVLDLPTFDPLSLMWQAYFTPPVDDTQTVSVSTTRRLNRYTLTREAEETINWPQGEILTERWHRRSDDGKTDAFIWLAPTLHYIPVKMRVTATNRGTVEALLDSIRIDETPPAQ